MLQVELAASTGRFEDLRRLAAEVLHMSGPGHGDGGSAGPNVSGRDESGSEQQRPAAPADARQDSATRPQPQSMQLLPQLLAAMQAQHFVWQRVKVAMLAHLSRRLRAQLADTCAGAAQAAAEAADREAAMQRRLQDVSRVSTILSACTCCCSRCPSLHCELASAGVRWLRAGNIWTGTMLSTVATGLC